MPEVKEKKEKKTKIAVDVNSDYHFDDIFCFPFPIPAFDFTGKYTTVTSSGFVVDNSPPIVTNAQFKFDYKYLTSTSSLSVW